MTLLMKPEPFSGDLHRLFDTLFENRVSAAQQRWVPSMDLVEAEDHFLLKADLPGLAEEDVNIEVRDNALTISGERKAEHERRERGWYRVERSFGSFSRSLSLPEGVDPDAITASFDRGVLSVTIPKPEQRKPRRIQIGGGERQRQRHGSRPSRARRPRSSRIVSASVPGPTFTIEARDGDARAGLIHTHHGDVPTPAFVPLATSGTVKGLSSAEVAELGYPMVLGNTFHLFITPGEDHVAEMGGLHEFMAWRRPIITDSGGFQVFSMGHGSVAEEIKRNRGKDAQPDPRRSTRRACASPPTSTGPSDSWARRRRWRSRPSSGRTSRWRSTSARRSTSTATTPPGRPSGRTAGSTAASTGAAITRRTGSSSTGSSRAAPGTTCATSRRSGSSRPPAWTASRSAGRSGRRRSRCTRSSSGRCAPRRPSGRATCSASATSTTSWPRCAPASTPSTAPRRPGSAATAPR